MAGSSSSTRTENSKASSSFYSSVEGLAWTPEGKEQPNLTYHSCATCGVRTHAEGKGPNGPTVAIQVATINGLDRDLLVDGIRYVDGLHDDFKHPPSEDDRGL